MTAFRINHLGRLGAPCVLALVLAGTALAETPATPDMAAEDAYLDILPAIDIPDDVQPIPGAMNKEWRNCQSAWPEKYLKSQEGTEARAFRDIYGFVQARSVIEFQDCGCATKAGDWENVETVAAKLREEHGTPTLGWMHTRQISEEADRLIAIAETMCGGAF